jgi:hypothetical protein
MIRLTGGDRLLQILNRGVLAVAVVLLVVKPTKLLEHLGVVGISIEHSPVCQLGVLVLSTC